MKAKDVKVGSVYVAKVSGKLARVRVLGTVERWSGASTYTPGRPYGHEVTHWTCENLDTKRTIEVKSAQRFRREVAPAPPLTS